MSDSNAKVRAFAARNAADLDLTELTPVIEARLPQQKAPIQAEFNRALSLLKDRYVVDRVRGDHVYVYVNTRQRLMDTCVSKADLKKYGVAPICRRLQDEAEAGFPPTPQPEVHNPNIVEDVQYLVALAEMLPKLVELPEEEFQVVAHVLDVHQPDLFDRLEIFVVRREAFFSPGP